MECNYAYEERLHILNNAEKYMRRRHRSELSEFRRLMADYLKANGWEEWLIGGSDYFCWWRCQYTHISGAEIEARPFLLWQIYNGGATFEEMFPVR